MGYVRTRQGKKGKTYQAHWTDDLGREQMKSFTKMGDAKDHIKIVEAAKLKGEYIDTASKITVSEYAHQWLANRRHRETTAMRVKSMVTKHIDGTPLGDKRLATVRTSDVEACRTRSGALSGQPAASRAGCALHLPRRHLGPEDGDESGTAEAQPAAFGKAAYRAVDG
jgi:hypothetical protein